MAEIFVNLKRFDVPKRFGGICPTDDPQLWIEDVMAKSAEYGLGRLTGVSVTFFVPEALILAATRKLASYPERETANIAIGCQGVHRENVVPGGNFGAFTTHLPAVAARNLGCAWAIIGHSEERKDKLGIIQDFEPRVASVDELGARAEHTVNRIINAEVLCALDSGLNVLLCVGETAAQRGGGSLSEQKPRIERVLRSQLQDGLKGLTTDRLSRQKVVIGYEPVWAIGPGKTPPDSEYIGFVASYIKSVVQASFGFDPVVVYGGGLKEENAGMISSIKTVGGGLVALTRFTGDIAFTPEGLAAIIAEYTSKGQ